MTDSTPSDVSVLYHYTTLSGLTKILDSKELWATDVAYLNDYQEFRHALDIALAEVDVLLNDPANQPHRRYLEEFFQEIVRVQQQPNLWIVSLSDDGDSLSQWRAYSGVGGIAIGFSPDFLRGAIYDLTFSRLVRCVYDADQQRTAIQSLIRDAFAARVSYEHPADLRPARALATRLAEVAPSMKHPGFADEREWRLVLQPMTRKRDRLGFRPGKSMLIPYYRLPIDTRDLKLTVHEIVVGPTPHPQLAVASVERLLEHHDLTTAKVRASIVPYRDW